MIMGLGGKEGNEDVRHNQVEKQMQEASQSKERLRKKRWCNRQGDTGDRGGIEDCNGFEMGCY
jgi:hypothetical protein